MAALLRDSILLGHSVYHDLTALKLEHPPHLTRDTASYAPFQAGGRPRKLRDLCAERLGMAIQELAQNGRPAAAGHSPQEDATGTVVQGDYIRIPAVSSLSNPCC